MCRCNYCSYRYANKPNYGRWRQWQHQCQCNGRFRIYLPICDGDSPPTDACAGVTIAVTGTPTNPTTAGGANGSISASATGGSGFTFRSVMAIPHQLMHVPV